MTSIGNSSSATINMLFGSSNSKRSQSALMVDNLTRATNESPLNTASGKDITKLGLSSTVLNLLQGTVGGDLMNQMLDDGSGYNPVTALMNIQFNQGLLRSAMSGQTQKNYNATRDASMSPVSAMIDSYNKTLNAANKPPVAKPTDVKA